MATQVDSPELLAVLRTEPSVRDAPSDPVILAVPLPRTWYVGCKPALEFTLALLLLLFAAPVIGVLALLVKLTSRGPAFYAQTRVGRDGRLFTLFKLRSMTNDCEKTSGVQWSKPGDSRITRVGAFLRRTHLDELPQLWNVVWGDMSLVGPRPERPEFIPLLARAIPHYRDRLAVRPGVTGLAQVQLPADTDMASVRRKVACDLYYMRHLNWWLDFRLIACTAARMVGIPYHLVTRAFRLPNKDLAERAYEVRIGRQETLPELRRSTPDRGRGRRPEPHPMPPPSRPNLLYVVHRTPYPPDKGDRIRTFHLLRHFSRRAAVHLACLADEPVPEEATAALQRYCERVAVVPLGRSRWPRAALALLRGRTITEGAFESAALAATLRDWARETRFAACIASASSVAPYLRMPELRDVPAVVDLMDVDSQKWFDYAAASRFPRSWLYRTEGRRLRRMEQSLAGWVRAVTLVSDAEVELFSRFGSPGVAHAIPNGVDLDYFRAPAQPPVETGCVFVGALDYRPNVDAACWFCREAWPEIHRRRPDARLRLVGRRPVAAVRASAPFPASRLSARCRTSAPTWPQPQWP